MPREVDPRPSPEKPLGDLFLLLFLPGYRLHDWQRKAQRASLRLLPGKRPDCDSVAVRKRVRNYIKFLTVYAYLLGFRITHALKPGAYLADFDGGLDTRQSTNIHDNFIV